jgi:hypothetical protein
MIWLSLFLAFENSGTNLRRVWGSELVQGSRFRFDWCKMFSRIPGWRPLVYTVSYGRMKKGSEHGLFRHFSRGTGAKLRQKYKRLEGTEGFQSHAVRTRWHEIPFGSKAIRKERTFLRNFGMYYKFLLLYTQENLNRKQRILRHCFQHTGPLFNMGGNGIIMSLYVCSLSKYNIKQRADFAGT